MLDDLDAKEQRIYRLHLKGLQPLEMTAKTGYSLQFVRRTLRKILGASRIAVPAPPPEVIKERAAEVREGWSVKVSGQRWVGRSAAGEGRREVLERAASSLMDRRR